MNHVYRPWRKSKNFGARITFLEEMGKPILEKQIEDLIDEICLYPNGRAEVETIIETMQKEIDARDTPHEEDI